MTPSDRIRVALERVRERERKATKGPWESRLHMVKLDEYVRRNGDVIPAQEIPTRWLYVPDAKGFARCIATHMSMLPEESDFIADARETVPRLLEVVAELEEYTRSEECVCSSIAGRPLVCSRCLALTRCASILDPEGE